MVPVAGGLPELLAHDHGRGDLNVAGRAVDLAPVVEQLVLERHAVGQEEREAGGLVAHHEDVHLAADLSMVTLLCLLEQAQVLVKLLLRGKGGAVYAGEHLVVLVALPVGAGHARELERLERLGVGEVRAHAHVDVLALLIEGDAGVLGKVADVLDLVLLATLLHEGDGLLARELEDRELEVLLHDLLHLGLDCRKVLLGDLLALGQVDVVVEAVVGCGAVGEVSLGVQALHGLRHDVGGAVTDDVGDLVRRALVDVTVVVQDLHGNTSLRELSNQEKSPHTRCLVSRAMRRLSAAGPW